MKLYVKKEDKLYYLDAHCEDTLQKNTDVYMGTIILDITRGTYYLLPTANEKYNSSEEEKMTLGQYFVNEVEENVLNELSPRIFRGNLTGELKTYAEEILLRNIEEYKEKNNNKVSKKAKRLQTDEVAYIMS